MKPQTEDRSRACVLKMLFIEFFMIDIFIFVHLFYIRNFLFLFFLPSFRGPDSYREGEASNPPFA